MSKEINVSKKPQIRSVIVRQGWAVVDRFEREAVSPVSPVYLAAKVAVHHLSADEELLVLPDGTHCDRFGVVRSARAIRLSAQVHGAKRKRRAELAEEVHSNGRPHDN